MKDYFGNSMQQLVSFFNHNKKINIREADEIIRLMEEIKNNNHD